MRRIDRFGLLSDAVLSRQGRPDMTWQGACPVSYWTYQAVLMQSFVAAFDFPESNQRAIRLLAVQYWSNASSQGRILDC